MANESILKFEVGDTWVCPNKGFPEKNENAFTLPDHLTWEFSKQVGPDHQEWKVVEREPKARVEKHCDQCFEKAHEERIACLTRANRNQANTLDGYVEKIRKFDERLEEERRRYNKGIESVRTNWTEANDKLRAEIFELKKQINTAREFLTWKPNGR